MNITKELKSQKENLLTYFRNRSNEILNEVNQKYSEADYKDKAKAINKELITSKEKLIATVLSTAKKKKWTNTDILECVLMITYTNYVIMLECRNSVWLYEYMSFSRRIGELWEPFCKQCFEYPSSNITLYVPPVFENVRQMLTSEIEDYISTLKISADQKEQLKKYYSKVWGLVTSGDIKLEMDLHFTDGKTKYVVDFKSGFGSNEKGNVNRLLLVGSIYQNIEQNYKCLLFVRSDENNSYLNTLKNSGIWETSCGIETYNAIQRFSGYNLKKWIDNNVSWMNDFSSAMSRHLKENNLETYLAW